MNLRQRGYHRAKTIFLVLVLLFFFPFQGVQAESLREEADRVCQAYIDKPDTFVAVAKKPDKCSPETGIDFGCAIYNLPLVAGKLADFWWPGTCGSASLGWVDKNNHFNELEPTNGNFDAGALRSLSVVSHQKAAYILAGRYGLFIDKVLPDGFVTLCGLYYHLDGWEDAEPTENSVCDKWAKGDTNTVSSILTDEISQQQEKKLHLSTPQTIISAVNVDFSGQGQKVQLVTVEMTSGAGCGCSRLSLRVSKRLMKMQVYLKKKSSG
ncbi:MAG: hypothetical protein PSY14_11265 [bacterium]|nr:hypothetical protein [bacterium]